jgi:hypothetical protein
VQKVGRYLIKFEQEFDSFDALDLVLTHWFILDQFGANVITLDTRDGPKLRPKGAVSLLYSCTLREHA